MDTELLWYIVLIIGSIAWQLFTSKNKKKPGQASKDSSVPSPFAELKVALGIEEPKEENPIEEEEEESIEEPKDFSPPIYTPPPTSASAPFTRSDFNFTKEVAPKSEATPVKSEIDSPYFEESYLDLKKKKKRKYYRFILRNAVIGSECLNPKYF